MKARYFVNKAKKIEQRLRDLQFDLYNFDDELKDAGLSALADKVTEAGFELDVSHSNMQRVWQEIENAYCRKVTTPNN